MGCGRLAFLFGRFLSIYLLPKKVYPIHTGNPQLFKKISRNVKIMEYGKEYRI
jgi:hypothetical protein